ncbi:hypothetical protein BRADI_2g25905v3 [Brachypodium distachyon]|uniref:Uncharacterized protein n=1 Tax=Brachypodium distachyon TaxID=15368 RepID=A0A0Q3G4V9_BRADI|nr:hypothetical protein BRADI_2g25905v3 [Brachypodium distachyon]
MFTSEIKDGAELSRCHGSNGLAGAAAGTRHAQTWRRQASTCLQKPWTTRRQKQGLFFPDSDHGVAASISAISMAPQADEFRGFEGRIREKAGRCSKNEIEAIGSMRTRSAGKEILHARGPSEEKGIRFFFPRK